MTLTFSVIGRGALTGLFTKSLRLTATRCDGVGFLMRELNAKSPRAKGAKKGRILLGQENSSGEWEPRTLSV